MDEYNWVCTKGCELHSGFGFFCAEMGFNFVQTLGNDAAHNFIFHWTCDECLAHGPTHGFGNLAARLQ